MNDKRKTDNLKNVLMKATESFFATWALLMAARMEVGNILTFAFFLLCFFLFQHIDTRLSVSDFQHDRRSVRIISCISLIFCILYMAVDHTYYVERLTNRLFRLGSITVVFIGFLILFYNLLLLLFSYFCDRKWVEKALFLHDASPSSCPVSSLAGVPKLLDRIVCLYKKHPAVFAFLLCLICWLPYFLYQYPGIMTPDSIVQLEQILHVTPYSNHHPLMHTLLMGLFYHIGYFFTHNMVAAMSFYTFFQMCFLSLSVSYLISTLRSFRVRPLVLFAITLFYALVPYNAVFSVTVWKDIPFAAGILFLGCSLLRLISRISPSSLTVFGISALMMCLFRSNGWYAFLLCLPFFLFFFRKSAKKVFPLLLAVLAISFIIKYPLMTAFHVTQPDCIESLSIPTQQIAAVICNDRALTDEQLTLIEKVVDLTYIKELYDPFFADNMKELVRAGDQDYLVSHKKEFFRLWLQLGISYPGDYLKAYIHQTYGYWYPDSFYPVAEAEGISATSLGISHTPLIGGPVVVKGKEIAIKLGSTLPLYGILFSMGAAFWVVIFCIGAVLIRQEKRKLILYLPTLCLILTVLIATPVATEFRYVYFLVFGLPFYLMSSLIKLPDAAEIH